jgi:hypothetical protein
MMERNVPLTLATFQPENACTPKLLALNALLPLLCAKTTSIALHGVPLKILIANALLQFVTKTLEFALLLLLRARPVSLANNANKAVLQEMHVMELLLLAPRTIMETLYATAQQFLAMMDLSAQLILATLTLEFANTNSLLALHASNNAKLIMIASNGQLSLISTNNVKPQSATKLRNLVSLLINSTKANAQILTQFARNAHQRTLAKPQNASMTKTTPLLADVQLLLAMMQLLVPLTIVTQQLESAFTP